MRHSSKLAAILASVAFLASPFIASADSPTLSIQSLSPGTTVAAGNEVIFSAVPAGFSSAPSYTVSDSFSGTTVTSASINSSGTFVWIPVASDGGVHNLNVIASDSIGESANASVQITVPGTPNVTIQSLSPSASVSVGTTVTFAAIASNFTSPTYMASDSFSGSSLFTGAVNASGGFVWTPLLQDIGAHTVTITAHDSLGNVATVSQSITVNPAASISIGSLAPGSTAYPGQTVTFTTTQSGFTNPVFTVSDALFGSSMNGTAVNSASGAFAWTPLPNDLGAHTITVTASDSSGHNASASTVITVAASTTAASTAPPTNTVVPASGSAPIPVSTSAASGGYVFTLYLSQGVTNSDVTALQNVLKAQGFLTGTATGYYGPLTAGAVKAFQSAHGIEPLGVVGPSTRAALNGAATTAAVTPSATTNTSAHVGDGYKFNNPLGLGSTGTDVTELQMRLTAEGVYSGPTSGYYGSLTMAAVQAYQGKHGISQLGNVGPATRAALNAGI